MAKGLWLHPEIAQQRSNSHVPAALNHVVLAARNLVCRIAPRLLVLHDSHQKLQGYVIAEQQITVGRPKVTMPMITACTQTEWLGDLMACYCEKVRQTDCEEDSRNSFLYFAAIRVQSSCVMVLP